MQIAMDYPTLAYDGTITFAGVLRKYFIEYDEFGNNVGISKRWNDETKEKYKGQYENRLVPVIGQLFGKEKPLETYCEDDFEEVLKQLNNKHHYAESTLQHYRHLLWVVYKAGFNHDHYVDNIFWADIIDFEEEDAAERESLRVKVMIRTRKSFSIDEVLKIVDWFQNLEPETASGEDVGLLFMFFLGTRNNEACGANIGSVSTLPGNINIPIFNMIQSTEIGSNKSKASGKTGNAPRILPLLRPFYDFLQKRKKYLEGLVRDGKLILTEEIDSVNKIPFVCRGNDYLVRASTTDLSKAGRKLFEKIGIDKRTLAVLHQILCSNEFKDLQIEEKEPTTYLFRRNFATNLHLLGFSLDEIQYLIGHAIDDFSKSKEEFTNADKLSELWERMNSHPINLIFGSDQVLQNNESTTDGIANSECHIVVEKNDEKETLYDIKAEALEPSQPIKVVIKGENVEFDSVVRATLAPKEFPRRANIIQEYQAAYRRHLLKN